MATDSIGKTVHMDDDFADRFIAYMEQLEKNPPAPRNHKINWGDPDKISKAIKQEYGYEG